MDRPQAVEVCERQGGRTTILELRVAQEDRDKLRILLEAAAAKLKKRMVLETIE